MVMLDGYGTSFAEINGNWVCQRPFAVFCSKVRSSLHSVSVCCGSIVDHFVLTLVLFQVSYAHDFVKILRDVAEKVPGANKYRVKGVLAAIRPRPGNDWLLSIGRHTFLSGSPCHASSDEEGLQSFQKSINDDALAFAAESYLRCFC